MAYAMQNLGWKFYLINGAWDILYLVVIYFFFIETKGLKLEDIAVKFEGHDFFYGAGLSSKVLDGKSDLEVTTSAA